MCARDALVLWSAVKQRRTDRGRDGRTDTLGRAATRLHQPLTARSSSAGTHSRVLVYLPEGPSQGAGGTPRPPVRAPGTWADLGRSQRASRRRRKEPRGSSAPSSSPLQAGLPAPRAGPPTSHPGLSPSSTLCTPWGSGLGGVGVGSARWDASRVGGKEEEKGGGGDILGEERGTQLSESDSANRTLAAGRLIAPGQLRGAAGVPRACRPPPARLHLQSGGCGLQLPARWGSPRLHALETGAQGSDPAVQGAPGPQTAARSPPGKASKQLSSGSAVAQTPRARPRPALWPRPL